MAITRKLKSEQVDALIQKGGGVAAEKRTPQSAKTTKARFVQLRVPPQELAAIDRVLERHRPPLSRHSWILEAIYEKLEREKMG
jgi:hypothetical protein